MTEGNIKKAMKYANNFWIEVFEEELEKREEEKNRIKINYEDNCNKPHLTITLSRMPKTCYECPLQAEYYDDEAYFGDGIMHYCPYGGDSYGCAKKRPSNCPIKVGYSN